MFEAWLGILTSIDTPRFLRYGQDLIEHIQRYIADGMTTRFGPLLQDT